MEAKQEAQLVAQVSRRKGKQKNKRQIERDSNPSEEHMKLDGLMLYSIYQTIL